MAPEIFKKAGHGKPVDVWAIGVITYFLLCGYTPFDRESQYEEMQAICNGDYKFAPAEYWQGVSETAKDFVRACLTVDPTNRPTVDQLLAHPWLAQEAPAVADASGHAVNLLPSVKKAFDAKKTCECYSVICLNSGSQQSVAQSVALWLLTGCKTAALRTPRMAPVTRRSFARRSLFARLRLRRYVITAPQDVSKNVADRFPGECRGRPRRQRHAVGLNQRPCR